MICENAIVAGFRNEDGSRMTNSRIKTENERLLRVGTGKRAALLMIILDTISETRPPRSRGPGVIPPKRSHPWTVQWRTLQLICLQEQVEEFPSVSLGSAKDIDE
jgi:hypothetical protein